MTEPSARREANGGVERIRVLWETTFPPQRRRYWIVARPSGDLDVSPLPLHGVGAVRCTMWGKASRPVRAVGLVGLILAATVLGALSLAGAPFAAGAAVSPANPDAWAYGTDRWFNVSTATPMGVHTISAYLGWYTVYDRQNVSGNLSRLSIDRTVLSNFTTQYCSPDCRAPALEVVLHHATYDHASGHLNITNNGSVYANGASVPAFAARDSSATADAWARSSADIRVTTPNGVRIVTETFRATGQSSADLTFTPPLGLVPVNGGTGGALGLQPHGSNSSYSGSGGWSLSWSYEKVNASGATISLGGTPSGTLAPTGNISLEESVIGAMTLPNGTRLPLISLNFARALDALDGLIFLPAPANFFDYGTGEWDGCQMAFSYLASPQLAIDVSGGLGALEPRAAVAAYRTNDSAVSMGDGMGSHSGPGALAPTYSATGVPPVEVSAEPMSPTAAALAAAGLASGAAPTVPGSIASSWDYPWPVLELALVVAVALVGGVAYLWYRRRRS